MACRGTAFCRLGIETTLQQEMAEAEGSPNICQYRTKADGNRQCELIANQIGSGLR